MPLSLGKLVDSIIHATLSTLGNRNNINLCSYWDVRDNEHLKMITEICLKTCQIHISMVYNSIPWTL